MEQQKKYKILIVEDEEAQRNLYHEYFTIEGFESIPASDGEEALRQIGANTDIDLILLDLMLPRVDGIRILEQIKSDPAKKDIKVIIMTVLGSDSMIKNAFEKGADAYIVKDTMNPDQIKAEALKLLTSNTSNKSKK